MISKLTQGEQAAAITIPLLVILIIITVIFIALKRNHKKSHTAQYNKNLPTDKKVKHANASMHPLNHTALKPNNDGSDTPKQPTNHNANQDNNMPGNTPIFPTANTDSTKTPKNTTADVDTGPDNDLHNIAQLRKEQYEAYKKANPHANTTNTTTQEPKSQQPSTTLQTKSQSRYAEINNNNTTRAITKINDNVYGFNSNY